MFPWIKTTKQPPGYYYQLNLAPEMMLVLDDLLNGRKVPGRAIERLKTATLGARRMNEPMVDLPWAEVEAEAKRQGVSVTDVLYDLMARKR